MKYNGKDFASKQELFDYIRANKQDLISLKQATLKHSDAFASIYAPKKDGASVKVISNTDGDSENSITRTIVGNTYYVMDSHDDVHIKGCFTNSIKERGLKRISHLHDHIYQLSAKVGVFQKIYEQEISWKDLGIDRSGNTWALLADTEIKRLLNEKIFDQYKDGQIDQHSVGMWYVKLELAIDDEDDEDHYKTWKAYIDLILNKEDAIKQGYFWVVKEAKLVEISAVLAGSNPVTPTLPVSSSNEEKSEASASNNSKDKQEKSDSSADGQSGSKKQIIYALI